MGSAGAVAHMFKRKGLFGVSAEGTDEDTLMGIVLDAGADDMRRVDNVFEITCDPRQFNQVQEALQKNNITPLAGEIRQIADVPVDLDNETGARVFRLMEALEDHDDVQQVYANTHISAEAAEAGSK
jgi:transcriptional/translational regulatory protein YebC/TACO1